jgi:long-chain acyl-CoA synthetase
MTVSTVALEPARSTFPKVVQLNAAERPREVAIREKQYGIWQSFTWTEYLARARRIALGLAALGFQRDDKTAIVGDNRPRLYWAMLATQALGGIPVPLYQDAIEGELEYVVDHAEARFAVVEDQEQVDKLLNIKPRCPHLEYIVYDDPRGLRHYTDPSLLSLERVEQLGEAFGRDHPS